MTDPIDDAFGLGPSISNRQKFENDVARRRKNTSKCGICDRPNDAKVGGLLVCLRDYGLKCLNTIKTCIGCAWACTGCLLKANRAKAQMSRGQALPQTDDVDNAFGLGPPKVTRGKGKKPCSRCGKLVRPKWDIEGRGVVCNDCALFNSIVAGGQALAEAVNPEVALLQKAQAVPRKDRPWSTLNELQDDALAQAAELGTQIDALGSDVRRIIAKAKAHPQRTAHNTLILKGLAREMGLAQIMLVLSEYCIGEAKYYGEESLTRGLNKEGPWLGPWHSDALRLVDFSDELKNPGPNDDKR